MAISQACARVDVEEKLAKNGCASGQAKANSKKIMFEIRKLMVESQV